MKIRLGARRADNDDIFDPVDPPVIDIDDLFDLESLTVSKTPVQPFEEVGIAWAIRGKDPDHSFSDYVFSLARDGRPAA